MNLQIWRRRGLLAVVGFLAFLMVTYTLIASFQWINRPFPGFFLYGNSTVGPYSLPQWSGKREGLKFLDHVIAVQGKPITHPKALYDLVRRYPAGHQFQYTVEKRGKPFQLMIPSMKFSFHDWLLSFGIYLLTGTGFLAIGVIPFYLRSTSPAAAPLFFMVSAIFLWFTTTFDSMATQMLPKELRIFAFTLTPSAGIHLGLLFTKGRDEHKGHRLYLSLIYGLSILLGLFYSFTFYGPLEVWHWALRVGYGYSCLAALLFLGLLWIALRHPKSDLERSRLRVVLIGAILGFFLPTLGTVLTSFFYWEVPYNLLLIPTVFFPLSVAYALLKYRLFDLSNILKVGLTRGALTGVLLLIYVLVVSLLSVSVGVYEKDPLVPIFFAVFVVLVFNPLLRWIEGVVDRYIYRKEYDPIRLQSEVSLLLRCLSRPQAIAEKYLKLVTDRVRIKGGLLFFRPQDQENYFEVSLDGETNGRKEMPHDLSMLWIHHFGTGKKGISRDEVESDPVYQEDHGEFLRIFSEFKSEILIPIIFEEAILGFVSLEKKRSGREYSADDFRLLCNLTDQLALSLVNGLLFEESEKAKEKYRLLYDQSQAMNKRLIESDKLKKQFVANISHELRTPISTILGYAEVLLDPGFPGDARVILERVVTNGQDLSQLIDSLLDFSRVETGAVEARLRMVKVRELFQLLEMMAQRVIKKRPIRFRVHIGSQMDVIETDPKKLQQLLMHLLTNALKFTERGEIVLEIKPVFERGDPLVEISVSDTGIGINEQDQEIIFEEFRQLDGSSTRRYGGTGLGLGLCKKLAQSLGGRIEVESEIGRGSKFSLILPPRGSRPEVAQELPPF
ncbi:MAG: hypothetical protein IH857_05700 [Deltaproteobacteria bacterium]|nr:hypothetical protein [Deltaproteobacteria bacterium]